MILLFVEFGVWYSFCNAILTVVCSFSIILTRKIKLVALLYLCSYCHVTVTVLYVFLIVPGIAPGSVIVKLLAILTCSVCVRFSSTANEELRLSLFISCFSCSNLFVFLLSCDCYCFVCIPYCARDRSGVCDCETASHTYLLCVRKIFLNGK